MGRAFDLRGVRSERITPNTSLYFEFALPSQRSSFLEGRVRKSLYLL